MSSTSDVTVEENRHRLARTQTLRRYKSSKDEPIMASMLDKDFYEVMKCTYEPPS